MNRNYQAGVRFERETIKRWGASGYRCIRAAGSHGEADVVAYQPGKTVVLIQCKVVPTAQKAQSLIKRFAKIMKESNTYCQILSVKVKGTKLPVDWVV